MHIHIFKLSIPFITDPPSDFLDQWSVQLYVKIEANDTVGWGETGVFGSGIIGAYSSILEDLVIPFLERFRGESPAETETVLEKVMLTAGNCGVVTGAISSIEMGLWDIKAKRLGTSLGDLLGGKIRERVPIYASFPRYRSQKDIVSTALKARERGFRMIKLHQPPSTALDALKEVREKVGYDLKVALDMNAPFDLHSAKKFVDGASKYEVEWIEEPIWPTDDYNSLEKLCEYSSVPIAAGENEYTINGFKRLLGTGISYVQPDIAKIGGVSKFLRILDLASSYSVKVAPHDRPDSSPLSLAYALQISSARSEISTIEYTISDFPHDLFRNLPEVFNGYATVPKGNGIGIEIIEDALKKYSYIQKLRLLAFSDLENRLKEKEQI
ncbi:mandelate racemase/muconate lactonizing enzyme family protein [Metallosphaera hakonensis]|uniref:Mandelate racemase/muconate lactonizing enzyme family protein n=1 Tax=Metallosphaera hakonensis JCM 8857 = DSM 7519 TaxID=1293036 RepID=A0A2U9IW82_9CREN|nr:mandelate racemase/muconate lactonizing enzyme family protein [Metallosphaera hakonensis]AWS00297.1 mandelate racemase/muconate lactonizing enzyme family protein [Metallosphaera hakonensis JCM 8857 = DSM 7519]